MRVLVVDPDDSFATAVTEHLTHVGFEAVHAASPAQMEAHLRIRTYDAVLVDLSLRRMNGFDVARGLRVEHPPSSLAIVLSSPTHSEDSPEIQTLKRDTKCRYFLSRPPNFDALTAALKRPSPGIDSAETVPVKPPASSGPEGGRPAMGRKFDEPPPRPRKPVKRFSIDWGNAKVLADLWLSRKTGVIVLDGRRSGQAGLVDGGIVDEASKKLVRTALGGGEIRFNPAHVDGVGDWRRMGTLLFRAACVNGDGRILRRHLGATPTPNSATAFARMLPLCDDARQFLSRVDGQATVESILDRGDIPAGEVGTEIMAVVQLGLLELVSDGRSVVQAEPEAISAKMPVETKPATSPVPSDSTDDDPLLQRLKREYGTIETAPPPVVLGVPADSPRAMVDRAAERMRARYSEIVSGQDVSEEVRHVATQIKKRIETAHRTFNFDAQMATGGNKRASIVIDDEVEILLNEGRSFIAAKQWAQADSVLARAHAKQIDHVPVLANLGWARLHNPEVDLGVRTEEGKDFLLLAEQFDPKDADGQYYLAQVLLASGMLEAAEERAERAVSSGEGDPQRQALLSKVRLMREKEAEKSR